MALANQLRALTPDGSHTLSKAWYRFPWGAYPPALVKGNGIRVWDADGNEFIDLICALGASTLGYNYENASLGPQTGASFSLPECEQLRAAQLVCDVFKAEAVRFLTTGSDACSVAVRAARAYTERDLIAVASSGYHGTHDWFTVLRDEHPGVPDWLREGVTTFAYNDLASLEPVLRSRRVALVMLEPCLFEAPNSGFLQGVVDLAHRYGALVCFDETILGGRMHLLGGTGHFDVWPDLRVYGKALGCGEAIAFLVGPMNVLAAGKGYSGTFLANRTGLLALQRGIRGYLFNPQFIENQWYHGERIQDALKKDPGVERVVDGYPWHPRLTFVGADERRQMSVFLQELADRGVLWADAGVNIPATMTDADCTIVCKALREAVRAVTAGVELRGDLIERGIQIRPRNKTL
jgi:glutamate-1-semialdehyde aminotransferase